MPRDSRQHDSQRLDVALRAARAALGSPEAVQRVRAGLAHKLASGLTPPALGSAAVPVGKGFLLLIVIGGGVWLYAAPSQQPSAAVAVSPSATVASVATEPVSEAPAAVRDAAKPELEPLEPQPKPAQRPRRPAKLTAAKASARAEPAPELDVDAEIALITQAQQRLHAQPAQALALLLEHGRRFPRGLLVQERETLRIDVERALGDDTQAIEHARQFVARFPSSPQARPLERWLAGRTSNSLDHKNAPAAAPTR
jgi:hypothetical protein